MEDSQSSNLGHAGNSKTALPLKVTFEILLRLPEKHLCRFKSVSKLWCSIIHSPKFVEAYLTRSTTRPRLLFTFEHLDYSSPKSFISAPEHAKEKDNTVAARHDMTISDSRGYYITSSPVNGLMS